MARREQDHSWKRRQEDWMEEDDLLGGDLYHGLDLRHKLQRANEGAMVTRIFLEGAIGLVDLTGGLWK